MRRAVACFAEQTYPKRELLIVPEQWRDVEEYGEPQWQTSGVDVLALGSSVNRCVGSKRNAGCTQALGDLIAVWDDDDYSAPRRLEQQVEELDLTRKCVTGYHMMKFTDGINWWSFSCGTGFVIGSSMMFRRDWWEKNRFEEINIGEDVGFCGKAFLAGKLAEVPDLSLMYATIHPGNTSKRKPGIDAGWVPLPGFQWPGSNHGIRKAWDGQRKA